ncbi:MAG: hypothetical protein L6Q40_02285 [Azonexus sp.]|nr:hypothetical protein [Azonexus sp.]
MRRNLFLLTVCLLSGLGASSAALADSAPTPEQVLDWQERMARAEKLQAQGKARREEAEAQFASQRTACETRFFVTACVEDARRAMLEQTRAGRSTENTGLALAREIQKEQQVDRERRLAAAQPARAAELAQRAAAVEAAQAQDAQQHQQQVDDKARRAAEGARRKQEAEARVARKQAEHAAALAARKAAAERSGQAAQ